MSLLQKLAADGVQARVVSMPCTDVFDAQEDGLSRAVLPAAVTARVVIEAGVTATWWRYAGAGGKLLGWIVSVNRRRLMNYLNISAFRQTTL